jgi:phosphoheptose isomerase
MPFETVDLNRVQTYPLPQRVNKFDIKNFTLPESPTPSYENPEFDEVIERILKARLANRPVIWSIGAHVIKRGLSPILIRLMQLGIITHIAGNGASTIHDFEIALQGHTSEDVASSIENGTFGMADDTGRLMNMAMRKGVSQGLGIGESLARWIEEDNRFLYKEHSVVYNAYKLGIPYTVHIAIGTDIIHQHPMVDFAAIGWGSGQDFKIYTQSICDLEDGVFCNFGSSVIGPEVFLKALSIARNIHGKPRIFTTANFDIIPLQDYRKPIGDDNPDYYYRPRKNIIIRPVSLGGKGFHINADHIVTIPNLLKRLAAKLELKVLPSYKTHKLSNSEQFPLQYPLAAQVLEKLLTQKPVLLQIKDALMQSFSQISNSFKTGGTLFVCGNGGSMSDALHISGELDKSFKCQRPVPKALKDRLASTPEGKEISEYLQKGLRTVVLGINVSLSSAVDNDSPLPHMGLAQELFALGRLGDVFLGISTSGNAKNIRYAVATAQAMGLPTIIFTGSKGGFLAKQGDICIHAPANETADIQEWHILIYHALCEMLETEFFQGDPNVY